MLEPSRLIRLRRPPQLQRVAERFVPRVDLDRVEARWDALRAGNPHYFDGDVLHVLGQSRNGHGGVSIHVAPTSYRFYAVQRPGPDSIECGVRPLGAKGIASIDGKFAMARRSQSVAFYPGQWEFVPGGGLEVDDEPATCVERELREETPYELMRPPIAVGLLFDPEARSWEVVHRAEVTRRAAAATDHARDHAWEHDDHRLVERGDWPEPLCSVARTMLAFVDATTE